MNDALLVRAPFNIEILVTNGVDIDRTYWNDEFNGTIIPMSLEGSLSGVIHIDKTIYFNVGDRFHIKLPHSVPEPFRFSLQPEGNGLQIRYLGEWGT